MPTSVSSRFRMAFGCGLLPLAVGVAIFLLCLATRWDILMVIGLLHLYFGCALFLIGLGSWGSDMIELWSAGAQRDLRFWVRSGMALVILLVNFPAAWAIMVTANHIQSRVVVTVINHGPEALTDVTISGGGVEADFGSVGVGATVQRRFHIRRDGTLDFRARRGSETIRGTTGYVTPGMGEHREIVSQEDGSLEVRHSSQNW